MTVTTPEPFDRDALLAKSTFDTTDELRLFRLAHEQRGRAERAEAQLAAVTATVEKFAGRKYDAAVQKHGDPEYWRGAEHAQDYIVQRVRTALEKEATA
jgi:hypothetical protein